MKTIAIEVTGAELAALASTFLPLWLTHLCMDTGTRFIIYFILFMAVAIAIGFVIENFIKKLKATKAADDALRQRLYQQLDEKIDFRFNQLARDIEDLKKSL